MNNLETIRNMSAEEIARWIYWNYHKKRCKYCFYYNGCSHRCKRDFDLEDIMRLGGTVGVCQDGIVQWLNSSDSVKHMLVEEE